jgi:hypothetical protein
MRQREGGDELERLGQHAARSLARLPPRAVTPEHGHQQQRDEEEHMVQPAGNVAHAFHDEPTQPAALLGMESSLARARHQDQRLPRRALQAHQPAVGRIAPSKQTVIQHQRLDG